MFFAEALSVGSAQNWGMSIAAVLMGVFGVTYSLRFTYVFFGKLPDDLPRQPHEPPRWMRFPVEFLVLCCLVVGIIPGLSIGPFLHAAVTSVLGEATPYYSLAVWHGFNLPLAMSFVALIGGVALYIWLRVRHGLIQATHVPLLGRFNGKQAYENTMLRISSIASLLEKILSTRRLQPQLLLMVVMLLAAPILLIRPISLLALPANGEFSWLFAGLWLMGAICAVAAAWQAKYHRLAALSLVGVWALLPACRFCGYRRPTWRLPN